MEGLKNKVICEVKRKLNGSSASDLHGYLKFAMSGHGMGLGLLRLVYSYLDI